MGREFELKYRANPGVIGNIREKYGDFTEIPMETEYYDTFDGKLMNLRWTLRRRMENGISVCTLKIPLADGSRGEWEVEAPGLTTGVPALCRSGAPMELMALTVSGIRPVCGARFTRLAKTLTLDNCTLEIALDAGVLIGGGRELPLWEVEVELKSGSEAAAVEFAQALAEEFRLSEEPESKYLRALKLAWGY